MFWGKDLQHRMSKKKSSPVPSIGNLIAQNRKEREREREHGKYKGRKRGERGSRSVLRPLLQLRLWGSIEKGETTSGSIVLAAADSSHHSPSPPLQFSPPTQPFHLYTFAFCPIRLFVFIEAFKQHEFFCCFLFK